MDENDLGPLLGAPLAPAQIDLVHLRYAIAAADHRSFRTAALALGTTQPTLSKRILELEERLGGVTLFTRSTAGARLTALGELVVMSARRIISELDTMHVLAKAGIDGDAGRLEIGFYTSLSTGVLGDAVFAFASDHPDVDVNITQAGRASLIQGLDWGALDIAFVLGDPLYRNYAHMGLWSERIMFALPKTHPLATRDVVYWTDLKAERFLISRRDPGPEIQDVLIRKLTSPGYRPKIKLVNAQREDILSAVNSNRGIALVCESSTGNVMPGIVYREIRDGNGPTRVGFVAYWRRDNDNPALAQFLAQLKAHPAVPPASHAMLL